MPERWEDAVLLQYGEAPDELQGFVIRKWVKALTEADCPKRNAMEGWSKVMSRISMTLSAFKKSNPIKNYNDMKFHVLITLFLERIILSFVQLSKQK